MSMVFGPKVLPREMSLLLSLLCRSYSHFYRLYLHDLSDSAVTDSQGRRESGIFEGNNKAYVGRFQECLSIQEDTYIGQYCTADIQVALVRILRLLSKKNPKNLSRKV